MPRTLRTLADEALAALVRGGFALVRALGPDRASDIGAAAARLLGPLTPAHRIARDNIDAAFPEKSAADRAAILRESWENLGRTACEYVHMGTLFDYDHENPRAGRIEISEADIARFVALREDGKPAIFFAAHLANWELPAVAARAYDLPSAALYRTPNNQAIARDIVRMRKDVMGELIPAGLSAPLRMMEALDAGLHLGMLVDQRFGRGPKIRFLGRTATANPLLARLARRFDCPVHGARAIRLPGNRFRLELTDAIELKRGANGQVDVDAATQQVNDIIEAWIREHPGQWLWQHRRWRM
ncbi:lipid A biosynthesis lauroyl acyltransferase [Falsiroseomonas sp. HW251]|uniref:lipid A biosynthesis lauroyl acyltransferase n=1 Tax=Falsiroseomonas sp. HW251 TaxID=3390998 RepID=UPI003D3223FE